MWEIKQAERKIVRLLRTPRAGEGSGREEKREIVQGLGRCRNRAFLIWSDTGR